MYAPASQRTVPSISFLPVVRFPFLRHGFDGVDAGIEFIPDQQDEGVDIDEDHQDDHGADGAVKCIVSAEVIHVKRESQGGQHAEGGTQYGAR